MVSSGKVASITVLLFFSVHADKLPDFIKLCSRSDPNIKECAIRNAKEAIPHLLNGYKPLNVPPLNPLKINSLEVETGPNLKLSFKDVTIEGFDTLDVTDLKIDTVNKKSGMKLHGKEFRMEGIYDIKGQILILPITGTGPAHIKLVDVDINFVFDWDVTDKNGVAYGVIFNETLTYTTSRSYYKLDNLFNGDKVLGDNMNKFLDENWKDINTELGPAIIETIKLIINGILHSIEEKIPFDNILAP